MKIDERGFTLLEVLVSLAIIAITLVTLLQTYTRNIEMEMAARDLTIASILAREKLERRGLGESSVDEDLNREGDERYPGFFWKITRSETEFPNVEKVSIRIFKKKGEEDDEIMRLSTFHFQ